MVQYNFFYIDTFTVPGPTIGHIFAICQRFNCHRISILAMAGINVTNDKLILHYVTHKLNERKFLICESF